MASETLGRQIQYNRSRLRICRAWVLNVFLASIAFVVWNARVGAVPFFPALILVGTGLAVCLLLGWTARALSRDHYINVLDSYYFLKKREPNEGGS